MSYLFSTIERDTSKRGLCRDCIQREIWCIMGPYAGVDHNLTLCRLQSRLQPYSLQPHSYARVDLNPRADLKPMPESTFSLSQGLRIWPHININSPTPLASASRLMKETPRRGKTVTSSFKEISTDQLENRVLLFLAPLWKIKRGILRILLRGSQRDVVYLGWPISALLYERENRERKKDGGGLRALIGCVQGSKYRKKWSPIWSVKTSFFQKRYGIVLSREILTGLKTGFYGAWHKWSLSLNLSSAVRMEPS
jgi:hypothetical protein